MKNKLFKFFEVGKLEKGLFRIWIVLCLIYYPFYGYSLITDRFISSDYSFYKLVKKEEKNNFDVLCEYHSKKTFKAFEGTLFAVTENVYGYNKQYIGIDLEKTFKSKKKCIGYNLVKKKQAFANFATHWIIFIFSPLIIALSFLFSKKLVLWLYRGFK